MTISELKTAINAKIIATNNIDLLVKINDVLNSKNDPELEENLTVVNEPAKIYENIRIFSAEEQRKINLAIQQYENGDCISDEEAQKEIQEWLND